MKVLIAYYSKTGGTEKLAEAIKKEFEIRGHFVDIEKVKPIKEHGFWVWWFIRMVKGECDIETPKIKDVSAYDAVCIGSPNWTRLSLPMAGYLQKIEGLKYKEIGFFSTTIMPPSLEWYIFSAYLLDWTFSRIIEKKGGRIMDSILFSEVFKRWGADSNYGKKIIKRFCDKMAVSSYSLKDYFLNQEEIKGLRLLILLFSISFVFSLIFHIVLSILGESFITWNEYYPFAIVFMFINILLITLRERSWAMHLGKYFAGASGVILWSISVLYWEPLWGGFLIPGYILFLIIISFFRDFKAVIFTGLMALFCYIYLYFFHPIREIFVPGIDLSLFLICSGAICFITQNLSQRLLVLLETQEEIELAKASLKVEVDIRTKESKELAESLDKQVQVKTKELQEKIEELEAFRYLAVGRELKMIELKKENEKLKKELKKT